LILFHYFSKNMLIYKNLIKKFKYEDEEVQ